MEPLFQLPIALPRAGSRSRLVSLHQQLRSAILDGRLSPGTRLPSTRSLAATCDVSRNTAVAAYELLLSEGYVAARRGSGTVVSEMLPTVAAKFGPQPRGAPERRLHPAWRARTPSNYRATAAARCDFRIGVPDAAGFPQALWRRLARRVERELGRERLPDRDPQGQFALREAIARHVSFTRAVACAPADLIVTSGAQQAFDLIARILHARGRSSVAVEDPGYPPLRAAFQAHGSTVTPVPVDADGLVVERISPRAAVVCVTPSHQFPLGVVMSAQRRSALLELGQRRNFAIIEDDYDSEFRFADRPLDALQTLDRAHSVFYVGTFSKSLSPDLRLGYIVAPSWALPALVAAKELADGHCNLVTQGTLALLIRGGHLARHVRRMRAVYARRRELILGALGSTLEPWLEPVRSVAGLHVAARVRAPHSEQQLAELSARAGVGVGTLSRYGHRNPGARGLIFGYGNIDEPAIVAGLGLLRTALHSAGRR